MKGTTTISVSAVGFFTFMMFWTLNGSSGRDMADVVIDYWDARVEVQSDSK